MNTNKSIISIKNLSFSYSNIEILKDINFDMNEGDFLVLVGPNGGGKSTMIKLILGLLPIQSGSIKIFGEDLDKFQNWTCLGYVAQNASHFDKRFPATVFEVVSMGRISKLGLCRSFSANDKKIIEQCLDDVQILEYKDTPIYELSGGQQQRVFIARALASDPCLLVLDEPTSGVDFHAEEEFYSLLQKLHLEKKLSIILISHDIDAIVKHASSFACLNKTLVYHGKSSEFSKSHLESIYGKNLKFISHNH